MKVSSDDPWEIPLEVIVTPQPLIGFIGLHPDSEPEHQKVWELFTSNRGLDRHALNFKQLQLDNLELPVCKPPRTSYEWYLPRGVLKKNWIDKHLNQLPSVMVLFFTSPDLSNVSATVGKVKMSLTGRQTKLAVVLLQEEVDQDTLTSICTECSIPSRAVFSLWANSGQVMASVVQLESTLQELASNYYHSQIKTVRSHRELLNRTTHLQLIVRHSFKVGFFSELKGDLHSAYKSYTAGYQLLLESRLTEHNTAEIRVVAGIISYKICRLAFRLNLPRDAITQFRKLQEQWRSPPGPPQLSWEHAAWQAAQAAGFGAQFVEACKGGQTAVQTQHPGIYYQLAAEYSISRRKLADSLCSAVTTYPSPDPLHGQASMDFYGQRPWRVGKQEPSDLAREKEGIEAMQFRERTRAKHSQIVLDMLRLATEQFRLFNCPRMVAKLTMQTAEEKMVKTDYKSALDTLLPCLAAYRQGQWPLLLFHLLSTSLKCSFLSCNLNSYFSLSLELCGLRSEASTWMEDEQKRVWSNVLLILDSGRPPLPEPSLTAKHERASVGSATKSWTSLLDNTQNESVDISEYSSCVDLSVVMPENVDAGQTVSLKIKLLSKLDGLVVKQAGCCFSNIFYNDQCNSNIHLVLQSGVLEEISFTLHPEDSDVGGQIEVVSAWIEIGSRDQLGLKLSKNFPGTSLNLEEPLRFKAKPVMQWESICKVQPRKANVKVVVEQEPPVLVGEWAKIGVILQNLEHNVASNVKVTCWLRDRTDPLIDDTTILSLKPESPGTPTTPGEVDVTNIKTVVGEVSDLEVEGKQQINIFLQASTVGLRVVVLQLSYIMDSSKCQSTQFLEFPVVQPFNCTTTFLTEALDETTQANTDEVFCICCSIKNLSSHQISIISSKLETSSQVTDKPSIMSIAGLALRPKSSVEQLFSVIIMAKDMLPQLDSQTVAPGKFNLCWTRQGQDIPNETVFELPTIKLSRASLYVEGLLPPFGVLRTPLQATYSLHNRTQDVQQFHITTEPSDAFMFSGPKQVQVKLFPADTYTISFIFYPLMCGCSPLPKLRVSCQDGGDVQGTLDRLLPSYLTIMPKERKEKEAKLNMGQLSLGQYVVVENLPYSKKGLKG